MEIYASYRLHQKIKMEWLIFQLIRLDDILVWHFKGLIRIDPQISLLPENFFNRESYRNNYIYLDGDLP